MKNKFLVIIAAVSSLSCTAQEMVVKTGAIVKLASGTDMNFSGLTLTPSAELLLTDQTVTKNNVVSNSFSNTYVSGTYLFSDTFVFSGTVRYQYQEAALNGLSESTLQLGVYAGNNWQAAGVSVSNPAYNFVEASGLAGVPLGELLLAEGSVLPLEWGEVSASRQDAAVRIQWSTLQERDVAGFEVERSADGMNWTTAIAAIPASNHSHSNYEQTDMPGYEGRLYYRIRHTDRDGRFAISKTVSVAPVNITAPVFIHPNPASSYFALSGIDAADIRKVDLINAAGVLLQSWKESQTHFNISGLPSGMYYLRILSADGRAMSLPLLVR